ncbi:MAG: lipoyl(octanoyl) transferase LipB [Thermoanaerobaculia bacterium]|nr:lipoyl(octanoyl) transferase LipB [Thermoanaerobaculia bacterium]
MKKCEVRRLHTVTYENGLVMQERLADMRKRDEIPDQLLLLQHPPVVTLGRSGRIENLLVSGPDLESCGVRFYETTRGGDITYHGPGQLVGYPIIHLGEGRRDIRKYVTAVEEVLIRVAHDFGIEATRSESERGVWVGDEKLAALGVRISRWTTSHGFALNVTTNLDHFRLITPCGIADKGVTSLQKLTGRQIDMEDVIRRVESHFQDIFELELTHRDHDLEIVKVIVRHRDRYLLLHRGEHDFWQPVTGRIESGEMPRDAARRELAEETGHEVLPSPLDLRQSFAIDPSYLSSEWPVFADERTFLAEVPHEGVKMATEEHDAFEWLSLSEALQRVRWSDDREALEYADARAHA